MDDPHEPDAGTDERTVEAISRRIEEDLAIAYAAYSGALVADPRERAEPILKYLMARYDAYSRWTMDLVKDHADVRRHFKPYLKELVESVRAYGQRIQLD